MHHGLSTSQKIALKVTSWLPKSLITDTERIGLSLGFMAVGATSLMALNDHPQSALAELMPLWAVVEWSITLFLGGLLTIWGIQISNRRVERVGIMLAAIGCLTYGISVLIQGSGRAKVVGILFLVLFLIKMIRLMVSTASAAFTLAAKGKTHEHR